MTSFTYTGDDTRYYPALGLTAEPGITAELTENPGDGRWIPTPNPKAKAAAPAPAQEGA
jgi:hypothetical protein